jgi:hypothetical protein
MAKQHCRLREQQVQSPKEGNDLVFQDKFNCSWCSIERGESIVGNMFEEKAELIP